MFGEGGTTVTFGPESELSYPPTTEAGRGGTTVTFGLSPLDLVEVVLTERLRPVGDCGEVAVLEDREWLLEGFTSFEKKLGAMSTTLALFSNCTKSAQRVSELKGPQLCGNSRKRVSS